MVETLLVKQISGAAVPRAGAAVEAKREVGIGDASWSWACRALDSLGLGRRSRISDHESPNP